MKDLTPKDKAKDLFLKFRQIPPSSNYTGIDNPEAKQCAFIAVSNEIKSLMWLNLLCTFDNYMKEHIQNKIVKLQEVEQEIEKL